MRRVIVYSQGEFCCSCCLFLVGLCLLLVMKDSSSFFSCNENMLTARRKKSGTMCMQMISPKLLCRWDALMDIIHTVAGVMHHLLGQMWERWIPVPLRQEVMHSDDFCFFFSSLCVSGLCGCVCVVKVGKGGLGWHWLACVILNY